MSEIKGNNEGSFAFMCGKCFQVFPSVDEIETHSCANNKENENNQIIETTDGYITAEVVKLEPPYASDDTGTALIVTEKGKLEYETLGIEEIARELDIRHMQDDAEYEILEDDGQRRKRRTGNNDYITNKLIRDPYFKVDHNSYTFKDTLGDWDDRSTKLLIILVGKHPKAHFILQFYFERRLTHWESIHSCMMNAGYNFTVLQLRMRWRELFAKYRWTLNHNDLYEEKKDFEYMKEMDELFGFWSRVQTESLLNLIEYNQKDNPSTKQKRLGYMGWERITALMSREGHKFTVLQVEARWRMLVITYKSMIDHNIMPTVEPIAAAFQDRLEPLVTYEPRRRKDYERFKGKKVKLEKFPESGMKFLIQTYKENASKFLDSGIKNAEVWECIKATLETEGYCYPVTKIKEIFFATLKLFERILQHNSIPGAISREGPHYKELSEIYNVYRFWPHVKRRRKTLVEKNYKKCAQRLRESMQTWTTEESRALLKLYPDILESSVGQTSLTQQNDLWVQVAQAFQALGYPKRDTPEIATHIGLLRQGYNQNNNFPFLEEMQRVMEVEEALCYSPDVSKYTGDVEILYWSHDAIYLLLNLYLKIQPLLPYSSLSNEVYARIVKEMIQYSYSYTIDDVREEFRNLLFQFTMRKYKPEKASVENWAKNKGILFYKDEMKQVMLLREQLSVGFTNGIKPIANDVLDVVYRVANDKCRQLFNRNLTWEEQKERMKLVVYIIRRQIKKLLKRKPPVARKICVHLLSSLLNISESSVHVQLAGLYCALENYDYEAIFTEIMKETHNGSFKLPRRVIDLEKRGDKGTVKEESSSSDEVMQVCVLDVDEDVKPRISIDAGSDDETCVRVERPNKPKTSSSYSRFGTVCSRDQSTKFSWTQDQTADIFLGETNEDFVVDERKSNKLVLINKNLGTKTTVLPQENSQLTCISIDDLNIKQEIVDPDEMDMTESVQLSSEPLDNKDENEFDIVHSLVLSEEDWPDKDCESTQVPQSSDDAASMGDSLYTLIERQGDKSRREEENVIEILEEQQTERKKVLTDLLHQINDLIE